MSEDDVDASDIDLDEAYFWLVNRSVTIFELRRLNRESLYVFPLQMLFALMDVGIDLDRYADATVTQVVVQDEEAIGIQWRIDHEARFVGYMIESKGDYVVSTIRKDLMPDGFHDGQKRLSANEKKIVAALVSAFDRCGDVGVTVNDVRDAIVNGLKRKPIAKAREGT